MYKTEVLLSICRLTVKKKKNFVERDSIKIKIKYVKMEFFHGNLIKNSFKVMTEVN